MFCAESPLYDHYYMFRFLFLLAMRKSSHVPLSSWNISFLAGDNADVYKMTMANKKEDFLFRQKQGDLAFRHPRKEKKKKGSCQTQGICLTFGHLRKKKKKGSCQTQGTSFVFEIKRRLESSPSLQITTFAWVADCRVDCFAL